MTEHKVLADKVLKSFNSSTQRFKEGDLLPVDADLGHLSREHLREGGFLLPLVDDKSVDDAKDKFTNTPNFKGVPDGDFTGAPARDVKDTSDAA